MDRVNARKKLPIGIEDFAKIRTEGFYYVDKTAMIRDLLNSWGEVNLFTRPRRFGKSLNMSMLKAFFEIGADKALFEGLEISKDEELCKSYMGRFPVISISLKSVSGQNFETACSMLRSVIGNEARRFESVFMKSDKLTDTEKCQYRQLIELDYSGRESYRMSDVTLKGSLQLLSYLLNRHYAQKVIILIDEYDVPLAKAQDSGYYPLMADMIRSIFDQALKSNESLYFAVMTGCLRVAKESIFTGLNHLQIFSITTVGFDEYFGFVDREVQEMLEYYGLIEKYATVKEWYDGYRFGNTDVYCPWDVISYCSEIRRDATADPRDYWSNTSSNDAVRKFIEMAEARVVKDEIENLLAGDVANREIHEELTYSNLYDSIDNVWSVLFMTGYLTQRGRTGDKQYKLAIPNKEIRNIFAEQIMTLFKESIVKDGATLDSFCNALSMGNALEVEQQFTAYLRKTISIRDTFVKKSSKENFYHGILVGILGYKNGWYVKSNKESGDGYSDILIMIEDENLGIIIEVKYAENAKFEEACSEAMDQIDKENYEDELLMAGCNKIYKYGIACFKKKCKVLCYKATT